MTAKPNAWLERGNAGDFPKRILILKPSSLGDVVQAIPVARLLKRRFPDSEVHWWIDSGLRSLLEGDPDVTETIPFERREWGRPTGWPGMVRSIRSMRRKGFDWVIDLQALARSALVAWFCRGRLTIGLEDLREGAPAFYDLAVRRPSWHTHAVDWYLEVPRRLGIPMDWDFEWLPVREEASSSVKARWPDTGERLVAIQPGARWPTKRWPESHFRRFVRDLTRRDSRVRCVIVGSPAELDLARQVASASPDRCLVVAGETDLPEMVEWLRRCELLVTNDTGPMHVAAALGTPVVALFGPTEPRRTGPYGQIDNVLRWPLPCVPCLSSRCRQSDPMQCMNELSPELVLRRVIDRLGEETGAGSWSGESKNAQNSCFESVST